MFCYAAATQTTVLVETSNGAVTLVGSFGMDSQDILQLIHAESQWREFGRPLQVYRGEHVAILVDDSYANCSYSAKWSENSDLMALIEFEMK